MFGNIEALSFEYQKNGQNRTGAERGIHLAWCLQMISRLLCSAPQSLPEAAASAHSSGAESESTSDSDSSSDSESESSSSDSEENEPQDTPAPEVPCPLQETVPGRQHWGLESAVGQTRSLSGSVPWGSASLLLLVQNRLFLFTCSYQTFGGGGLGERSSLLFKVIGSSLLFLVCFEEQLIKDVCTSFSFPFSWKRKLIFSGLLF